MSEPQQSRGSQARACGSPAPEGRYDEHALGLDLSWRARAYYQMALIRRVESGLLDLFARNLLFGTTHTCLGQEADAVGVIGALDRGRDLVFSNHRCHGHFLAYCGKAHGLVAEIMGRATGVCGGRGGSQHLHWNNFFSNGIQGGMSPIAVGAALAEKEAGGIACIFLGDGTLGQGVLYESLNMASLWNAPVLFVVEDNAIAQTTPGSLNLAGEVGVRAAAFGIRGFHHAGTDVEAILTLAAEAVDYVRSGRPAWLHLETVRMGPHSKGDDTRPAEEIERAHGLDPLLLQRARVPEWEALEARAAALAEAALTQAMEDPPACAS